MPLSDLVLKWVKPVGENGRTLHHTRGEGEAGLEEGKEAVGHKKKFLVKMKLEH